MAGEIRLDPIERGGLSVPIGGYVGQDTGVPNIRSGWAQPQAEAERQRQQIRTKDQVEANIGRPLTWFERAGLWWDSFVVTDPARRAVNDYDRDVAAMDGLVGYIIPGGTYVAPIGREGIGIAADFLESTPPGSAAADAAQSVTNGAENAAKAIRNLGKPGWLFALGGVLALYLLVRR